MVCGYVWLQRTYSKKDIGLRAHSMMTILSSKVTIIEGDVCDHSMNMSIFSLTMNKIFIQTPKNTRKSGYGLDLEEYTRMFLTIISRDHVVLQARPVTCMLTSFGCLSLVGGIFYRCNTIGNFCKVFGVNELFLKLFHRFI